MTLYFVAGEASGDTHGAALLQELHSLDRNARFTGRGGPRMKSIAGEGFLDWSEHSAVLGLWEVLKQYGYFRREFGKAIAEIREQKPDAVVLIDYPGFNLRLARALRGQLPQLKIIYYISPQVWAWNRGRIGQMARYLDLMLCIFPFEAELYNKSGLRTIFVGHPMIQNLAAQRIDVARDPNLIALFPGSRAREIRKILPPMLQAAAIMQRAEPQLRFEVAAALEKLAAEIREFVQRADLVAESIKVVTNESSALMQRARLGLVASGTATLEAAYFGLPFILVYRVASLTYLAARLVVRVKYLGMPNVLAGRAIVPEFIQGDAQPEMLADAALTLLRSEHARQTMTREFATIIGQLGEQLASETAAREILRELAAAQ